ncbi:DUF6233 domain-containing protein [Streptomyces griseoincarnatus]
MVRGDAQLLAEAAAQHSDAGAALQDLQKLGGSRGPDRGVLHAPDCEEAPQGAPLLDVERALDVAEHPGTRLCTLCGTAQVLTPMLSGFDHITDS